MTFPVCSVIVAVKNGEKYLHEALGSILAQTYRPIELIVVDGHSSDRTVAIAASFSEAKIIAQSGQGIADAYNTGIAAASGEFTAFLSSDDIWAPEKLDMQIGYMLTHPHLQFTVSKVRFMLEAETNPPPGFRPEWLEGERTAMIMETLVARRSAWELVGCFDTTLRLAEDVDWFSRARHVGAPMAVLPHTLLHKRIHGGNASLNVAVNNQELLKTVKRSIERRRNGGSKASPVKSHGIDHEQHNRQA